MKRHSSRLYFTLGASVLLLLLLAYAFWPRPMMVDLAQVERGSMRVTIDEIARTRVHDAYVVSAPVAGQLLRVEVEPGDKVVGGETRLARLLPAPPSALDIRSREQAQAAVETAQAALRLAQADLNKAIADRDLAQAEVERARRLRETGSISVAELDRAERGMRAADAAVDTASAAISMREAEIKAAQARLIEYRDGNQPNANQPAVADVPLRAPVSGQVLRVLQESETTLAAGTPILEIGDVNNDLEVVAELLSTDAVQVEVGDPVIIDNWGGSTPLSGEVQRVDPWGFTKYSALGVEEQRVNVLIRFVDLEEEREELGHGYRVEARIVVWQDDDALIAPSSALFRDGDDWAAFRVDNGTARQQRVAVGHNNGTQVEILDGLSAGDRLVLYPPSGLTDGQRVKQR